MARSVSNGRCFDGDVYIVKFIFLIVFLTPVSFCQTESCEGRHLTV